MENCPIINPGAIFSSMIDPLRRRSVGGSLGGGS